MKNLINTITEFFVLLFSLLFGKKEQVIVKPAGATQVGSMVSPLPELAPDKIMFRSGFNPIFLPRRPMKLKGYMRENTGRRRSKFSFNKNR